jgi:hypothetical protein
MSRVSGLGTTARARHAARKTNTGHVGQPRRGSTTKQLPDATGIRSSIADCGPPFASVVGSSESCSGLKHTPAQVGPHGLELVHVYWKACSSEAVTCTLYVVSGLEKVVVIARSFTPAPSTWSGWVVIGPRATCTGPGVAAAQPSPPGRHPCLRGTASELPLQISVLTISVEVSGLGRA